jgi:HEPN domain-containing protein
MNEKTLYWLNLADYDLDTAEAMLQTGRYLYVGFMCHQVIEKALKAVTANGGSEPPKIHRLRMLASLTGTYDHMTEEQQHFLSLLEPLNIEGRYPGEYSRISSELSADRCRLLMAQTREVYEWIKSRL